MMHFLGQYWVFAAVCVAIGLFLFRLILHERITLQGSLFFLLMLGLGTALALFPDQTSQLAASLGFSVPSNFFFAVCIGALVVLHLSSLITLSRVEARSVVLTQEVAILQEKLRRAVQDMEKRK